MTGNNAEARLNEAIEKEAEAFERSAATGYETGIAEILEAADARSKTFQDWKVWKTSE